MNRTISEFNSSTMNNTGEVLKKDIDSSSLFSKKNMSEQEYANSFSSCLIDNLEYENRNQQSTQLSLERFDMHKLSNSNNTSSSRNKTIKVKNLLDEDEKERLLTKIYHSYFESGIWTEADEYFEYLTKLYSELQKPLGFLSSIVNNNLKDEHVLEGILHILSNYSYDILQPFGITIALACTVNHSPVIQDLLITCFENWNSRDAIPVLSGLKLDKPWLIAYRDEVLERLRYLEQNT